MAQNVGSTLRPTPEMVEVIENVKKFREALETIRDFGEKMKKYAGSFGTIDGRSAFKLYDTYGFPIELTMEMAHEKGIEVDEKGFEERFKQHQATSHAGAEQRFKGGLADNTEETAKLHTATHLLHAALRKVLGNEVAQKGSNITAERLRFDFSFGRKMTPEELAEVERLVNEAIAANVPVTCEEMTVDEAKAQGAIGLFTSKYGERVKVYTMGNFSKEICGGPHASNTGDLKSFKIKKEESSSAGVRRIKGRHRPVTGTPGRPCPAQYATMACNPRPLSRISAVGVCVPRGRPVSLAPQCACGKAWPLKGLWRHNRRQRAPQARYALALGRLQRAPARAIQDGLCAKAVMCSSSACRPKPALWCMIPHGWPDTGNCNAHAQGGAGRTAALFNGHVSLARSVPRQHARMQCIPGAFARGWTGQEEIKCRIFPICVWMNWQGLAAMPVPAAGGMPYRCPGCALPAGRWKRFLRRSKPWKPHTPLWSAMATPTAPRVRVWRVSLPGRACPSRHTSSPAGMRALPPRNGSSAR